MGYYSVLERNELPSHKKAWRKPQCMLLSKRSQSEKTTCCSVPTVWHSGNGKTMATVKRDLWLPGVKRVWGRGDEEAEHRTFLRLWKYSLWYLSLYICSNIYNLPALIMTCQWRFISSDKCTILVGGVDNRGGYAYVRVGGIWELSVPYSQFCFEPKIALKN